MNATLFIGIVGMILILTAFLLDEFKKISQKDRSYQLLNFLGSGLLSWYAVLLGSWPFLILNAVWFLISLWRLTKG